MFPKVCEPSASELVRKSFAAIAATGWRRLAHCRGRQLRTIYRFDQFCLDQVRGALRDSKGSDLALRPKAFLLLQHLLDRPHRLHSRDDLFEVLWPGVTVSDDSLTQCVSDLRRAFGSRANQVLRTVPRRGYMLIVDVEKETIEPVLSPRPTAHPALAGIDSTSNRNEFLILERISTSSEDAELLGGIWNEVFLQLARFQYLRVFRADGRVGMPGYRVRCDALVTDGRVRASVLLEDAETGMVVWTEQVDEPIADRSAMTEMLVIPLAHRIARQTAAECRRRAHHKLPASLNARELCLLAGDHHQRGTEADTATAQALLERAIAIDPGYAPAYAWQAYVVQRGLTYGWGPLKGEAARDRALALARQSAVLAPESPLSLSRLAYCLYLCGRWDEAILTARMALTGAWTAAINERVTCSEVLAQGGHPDEAVQVMRRTLQFDRYAAPTVYSVLGRALLMAGRPGEALPELRICAARLPDYAGCHHSILMAAHEGGLTDEAIRAYENIQRLQPGWRPSDNGGPWMFRQPADLERLHAAFNAAQAALQPQQHAPTADVLSFRLRDGSARS
jgi:DNA-binding winged helix-turn-helix (wHTH) protein/tetratricopeptide (TPR) repeat protein